MTVTNAAAESTPRAPTTAELNRKDRDRRLALMLGNWFLYHAKRRMAGLKPKRGIIE